MKDIDHTNKKEFSDPSHFYPLIIRQKKLLRHNRNDPREWVKLGCLYEEKLSMVHQIARSNFLVRYCVIITILAISLFAIFFLPDKIEHLLIHPPIFLIAALAVIILILILMFFTRYPRSGRRFFIKAISLEADCGEAYMYLGFIALRRFQKKKGSRLLEHALQLGIDDKRIKRELKFVYEKEFMTFFNSQKDWEQKKQDLINNQLEQIKKFQAKIHLLNTNISLLTAKAKQTQSNANRNVKIKARQIDQRMEDFQKEYEKKIAEIEKKKTELEKKNETESVIYVKLTDELFESELKMEQLSFHQIAEDVKNRLELDVWESLSKQTRYYLITAEQTFSIFAKSEGFQDYSLIGLEWCKALELEINRKFITPFVEFINNDKDNFLKLNKTGERKNKPKYFSYLPMVVDEVNYPEMTSLTLGQFHFVLKRSLKNEYAFQEYRKFIDEIFSSEKMALAQLFLKKLGIVVKRYRNVIAHLSSMNQEQCEHLRELIFLGNDSLLQICSIADVTHPLKPTATL